MLRKLFEILLGTDSAPWTQGESGSWHLEWLSRPSGDWVLVILVLLAVATWGTAWLYKKEGRNLTLAVRSMLTSLRILALLGVLIMLLEPVIVFTRNEWQPSNLLVLKDVSESMDLKDAYQDSSRADHIAAVLNLSGGSTQVRDTPRSALVDRALAATLRQRLESGGDRFWRETLFTGRPIAVTATQPAEQASLDGIDRTSTGIGTTIREMINAYRGQPIAGVLLITDGQSNTGESAVKAAEYAGSEGVPIVTMAAGTAEGPRNIKLSKLDVDPVVFVRDTNQLKAIIESRGMNGSTATVLLERRRDADTWEEVSRQSITLGETGSLQTVVFDFSEQLPTRLDFRVSLLDVGPELTVDDNTALAEVRVIRQKIRVLLIAGSTFPEVQFIRNALMRDKGIDLSSWLQSADADYEQPGTSPIRRLPRTPAELNDYDCVVLYDPDPEGWPQNFPSMLEDFVGQAGGGLIYVAGERMTRHLWERQGDPSTAWASILPVVVEPGLFHSEVSVKISSREPWRLDITPEGRSDPIFQFGSTPEENEKILASLPGMYWHFPVTRAKPGATVLARHGDPRMRNQYGPHVLLATQLVGPGRTFFVGFDSTYRWRYLDDQYFDGFWARMIDRAGRSKQLGGRYPYTLTTDRATYRPGSQVTLSAHFVNPNDLDAGIDVLRGEVEFADQPPLPLTLAPKGDDRSTFETTFSVSRPGPHLVRIWTGDRPSSADGAAGPTPRAATLQFPVELPSLEYDRPTQDRATLDAIAKASGGVVYNFEQIDELANAFKVKRVARVLEDRQEIWHAPLLWMSILAAIVAEWLLRKKYRLI